MKYHHYLSDKAPSDLGPPRTDQRPQVPSNEKKPIQPGIKTGALDKLKAGMLIFSILKFLK